jgi:uncharacterized protein
MVERTADFVTQPAFVADSTLGRLAKWLRLAGFDTRYDPLPPDWRRLREYVVVENRKVLTRTRRVMERFVAIQGLLIRFDAPIEQVRQVMNYFNISRNDLRPLSRCSRCNRRLQTVDRTYFQNAVPDFVRQRHTRFLMCGQCGRIYWPGTHSTRMTNLFERWFE